MDEAQDRLERLTRREDETPQISRRYSLFIRWMRLALPVVAVAMIAVVFSWNSMTDQNLMPVQDEVAIPSTAVQNELLNPRFESTDENEQPYTITAKRALQGRENDDLVVLEKPTADMLLNNGHWIAIKAAQGAFTQDTQKLLLKGNVQLYHDLGYQLETETLNIDMQANTAHTNTDVHAHGPAGTLDAKGLKGWADKGYLVFNGPAKLVLNSNAGNLDFGGFAND